MLKQTLFSILLLLFSLTLTTNVVSGVQRGRMVGTRIDIKDVKSNKEVQELGKFSVEEYNKGLHTTTTTTTTTTKVVRGGEHGGSNGRLRFVEVVEAQRQVVSGMKYYLKVEAMQGENRRTFDAVVVVKPWVQSKKLLNFGPAPPRLNILETPGEVF